MKTRNEKRDLFLDMQKHPENYTDEQIEAMMNEVDATPDVEAQWQRFEKKVPQRTLFVRMPWIRQASIIVAGIFLSGVVYAITVATGLLPNVFSTEAEKAETATAKTTVMKNEVKNAQQEQSVATYDDVPLADILQDMADFYGVSVSYRNASAKSIRLYFQWDRSASLADNIAGLNAFQRIRIALQENVLTVE